ncbi:MAG: histidine phosphatase family protein [Anaerolineaceae bacterium]
MTDPKLTTIYFIRHAESDISVREDRARPLTVKGLADSARLAEWFRDVPIDHIYSSPYLRAWQTLSDLAALKGLDIQPEEDFRERQNCGWEPNFIEHLRWLWEDFNHCKAGEEALRQVQGRNIAALNKLLDRHQGETIVVGTHGTALSMIIHHYDLKFGLEDFMRFKNVMPWVVKATFNGLKCEEITEVVVLE